MTTLLDRLAAMADPECRFCRELPMVCIIRQEGRAVHWCGNCGALVEYDAEAGDPAAGTPATYREEWTQPVRRDQR
jgi:transcription elongation factor Elf1